MKDHGHLFFDMDGEAVVETGIDREEALKFLRTAKKMGIAAFLLKLDKGTKHRKQNYMVVEENL